MSDRFQSVIPGQQVRIPANTWNSMLAAAREYEQNKFNVQSGSEPSSRKLTLAKVRNQTGLALQRFSIVGLGNPIITPGMNLAEFQRQSTFEIGFPSAGGRFGVLLEPLAETAIGTAAVAGVIATRIAVGATAYECAVPVPGLSAYLLNVPHGPAKVLWMESTGAVRWCLIRLDDSNYEEIVYITSNIADSNGFYPGVVQRYDVATGNWVSQFTCKVLDANQ